MEEPDFITQGGLVIFSKNYLIRKGECCGCGCFSCPYEPPFINGNSQLQENTKEEILKIENK